MLNAVVRLLLTKESSGTRMLQTRLSPAFALLLSCLVLGAVPVRAHEDRDDTLARLDATLAENPGDPELWRSRAVLERSRANFARAHADLTKAVDLGLAPALAQRDRGLIWLEAGRFADAEASLCSARAQSPRDLPTLLAHARALAGLERWREAAAAYAIVVELEPRSNPDVHLERVRSIEAAGGADAFAEAVRAADAGIAVLGPVPALQQAALELEMRAGRVDAALARLDRMANAVKRHGSLLLQRAELFERAGRMRDASLAYADALAALEGQPETRRALPAARRIETRARDGITRLARQEAP